MAVKVWIVEYKIRKVDGTAFPVPTEMHRLHEEQVTQIIKESALRIADRFDFPYVEVTAKCTDDGQVRRFVHKAEEGYRDEWTHGRQ